MSSASPCSIEPARACRSGDRVDPVWLDERELQAVALPARLRAWLVCDGLLTDRIRAHSPDGVRLKLRRQHEVVPEADALARLECGTESALAREIELLAADRPVVFARTLIPLTTLESHAWLRDLGETPLGEALAALPDLRRGRLEFALLPTRSELYARAAENVPASDDGLWMRRSWFGLPGGRLLVTEVFLPAVLEL